MSNTKKLMNSGNNLSKLMNDYYKDSYIKAKKGDFIIWIAIVVPIELLKGFDVIVTVPENYSAMCAAKKVGVMQAEKAEALGYSMDICSYARIDIGTALNNGADSPIKGLPKPDLLISNNNNCSLLVKWFDVYHRELNVPHFILDVPFCYEEQSEKNLKYIVEQFKALIALIEDLTGQTFDITKVKQAINYSNEAIGHWKRFLNTATHQPSGITAFDTFVHMAPFLTYYRGTPQIVEHFKMLADETEKQMKENIYPVPNEKYRLLWDNIAPWHQLRAMSTRLADLNTNIIQATYTSCLGTVEGEIDHTLLDPSKPLESLARMQNFSVCPYGLDLRMKAMSKMIKKFKIDGVVFTNNFSCKVYSLMQYDLMDIIKEKFSIPCVIIDVDHADVRKYNEEKVFLKIESLLDAINNNRRIK